MREILQIASGVFIGGVGLVAVWSVIESTGSREPSDPDAWAMSGLGCAMVVGAIALVAGLWWAAARVQEMIG